MGILKIEMEVPDFKDSIELSLTLKKDGEVITTSKEMTKDTEKPVWTQDMPLGPGTVYPKPNLDPSEYVKPAWKQEPIPEPKKFVVGDDPNQKGPYCGNMVKPQSSSSGSGNFMNINIDEL